MAQGKNVPLPIPAPPMTITSATPDALQPATSWNGVYALAVCAFALIASEFLPVSLLTPIAADLGISEGMAGQGIAISGAFAVLASLLVSSVVGSLDACGMGADQYGIAGGLVGMDRQDLPEQR